MDKTGLKNIIADFSKTKILVIGDLILDEFIWGNVQRISPEAPVPVVWAQRRQFLPGGAANVADNLRSLGAQVSICGVVGGDHNAKLLRSLFKKKGIDGKPIFTDAKRPTTIKTRVVAQHQQVVRVDWEDAVPLKDILISKISSFIKKNINKYDALIIEDYGKGIVNKNLLTQIIPIARKNKKIITVDPKEEHFGLYRGVTAITPNLREAENAIHNIKIKDKNNSLRVNIDKITDGQINKVGRELLNYLKLKGLLITLGDKGMRLFDKSNQPLHIDTVAQDVFDVTGAGDTVIAVFTLALASGASFTEAAHMANFAAGIVVGELGTATVTRKELINKIKTI